jgi:transposase-like protein
MLCRRARPEAEATAIESEPSSAIGAGLYERTESRTNERNGRRPRVVSTKAGDISLGIPKLRKGSFFPNLEPRRRIDQALYAIVMEATCPASPPAVDELVQALGIDSGISKSEVNHIFAGLDTHVSAFRERRLDHTSFPCIWLDATYLHVRDDHQGRLQGRRHRHVHKCTPEDLQVLPTRASPSGVEAV